MDRLEIQSGELAVDTCMRKEMKDKIDG